MVLADLSAPAPPGFIWADWAVIAAYMLFTTILGARLAGRQATIRDFFLGGRKLPWWAISGSIIATEISAATIVGVPVLSYAAGGDLTYLQLALGSIIARIIVAMYFVPRYYEEEIYSPYDYAGKRLGPFVKQVTSSLFLVGAVLGQGARLYITAFVLSFVADVDLRVAIWIIGVFAVLWTLMGGMTTVIWTDVIQFGVMSIGAIVALVTAVWAVPGGIAEVISDASAAGKFRLINADLDLSQEYTLIGALIAMPFLNLAAFGTDQVMAQRMFCARDARDARKAILWSNLSLLIPVIMLMVGISLYAYFQHRPLTPLESLRLEEEKTYLLPIFISRALPVGIRAIIAAAIFAAAISTLEGALTALAQASLEPLQNLFKSSRSHQMSETQRARRDVWLSRLAVLGWSIALCLMAMGCIPIARDYKNVINLALGLAAFIYGPLLGIFMLAFLRIRRDDSGIPWAVPISVLAILAISVKLPRSEWAVWIAGACIAGAAIVTLGELRRIATVLVAIVIVVALQYLQRMPGGPYLAFTWSYPLGTIMTFTVGYLLGRPRPQSISRGFEVVPIPAVHESTAS